jgi:hypothetical protein
LASGTLDDHPVSALINLFKPSTVWLGLLPKVDIVSRSSSVCLRLTNAMKTAVTLTV